MPRSMTRGRIKVALCAGAAASALLALAPAAHADTLDLTLSGRGLKNQVASIAGTVNVTGKLSNPGGPGVPVTVTATVGKDEIFKRQILTQTQGNFTIPVFVNHCCQYKITATANPPAGPVTKTAVFNVGGIPKLHIGSTGPKTKLFLTSLREQGYFVRGKDKFTSSTQLAILAFRKVNKLHRNTSYSKSIFKHPADGPRRVPARPPRGRQARRGDLSRQVLVFADGRQAEYTFPISTGASATPTVTRQVPLLLEDRRATTRSACTTPSTSSAATRSTATTRCRTTPPATAACAPRSPIQLIYNWIYIGDDDLRLLLARPDRIGSLA